TIVGKISKKLKTKVLIDHWVGQDRSENVLTLVECRSCKLNGQVSNHTGIKPLVLEEVVGYRASSGVTAVNSTEEEVASIVILKTHEESLIRQQEFDIALENKLVEQLKTNLKAESGEYLFYTDGS
ncbi:2820_t:CDS:2, partial [Dentiscutata heterogama]